MDQEWEITGSQLMRATLNCYNFAPKAGAKIKFSVLERASASTTFNVAHQLAVLIYARSKFASSPSKPQNFDPGI
eukprot:1158274-Pelagomonas_calceolata.AAC.65